MATVDIMSQGDLKTAIDEANAGAATTGLFENNVTETIAPDQITTVGLLTLDGVNLTLRGDGTDAALIVNAGDSLTVENLMITNGNGAAAIQIGAGGTVMFADDGSGDTNIGIISSPITGAGSITVGGSAAGPLFLNAANTYTGTTTITGDLVIGTNGSIATSTEVSVAAGGVLDISAAQTSTGGVQTVGVNDLTGVAAAGGNAASEVILGRNTLQINSTSTFAGVIENSANTSTTFASGGGVTIQTGTLTLTGADTYTGATKIFGTLDLMGAGTITQSSNVSLKSATAILDLTGNAAATVTVQELTGVAGSTIRLGSATAGVNLTVDEDVVNASFSGVITGAGNFATAAGVSSATPNLTLTLAGANTYTGTTTIGNNSELALSGTGSIAASALTDNGVFDISAATAAVTVKNLAGAMSNAQTPVALNLGANRLIDTGTTASTFGGVIGGSGSLQVGASSTGASGTSLTLTDQNDYTGATVVFGSLILGGNTGSVSDSSNVSLKTNGAVFNVSAGNVVEDPIANGQTASGVFINELTGVGGSSVVLGANNLIVNETVAASFTGVISGSGGLEVDGAATLTLMGANTYTGATTVFGHLALGNGGMIAATTDLFVDGAFDISGASSGAPVSVASLNSDNGQGSIVLGGNTLNVTNSDAVGSTFGGVISGNGNFEISGGTVVLNNASTFTGTTTITAGATLHLVASQAGTVGTLASSSIIDGGALLVSATETVGSVISGAGTVTVSGAQAAQTNNTTVVTLTGTDIYTGQTNVMQEGTLAIGAGGSISSSSGVVLSADNTMALPDSSTFDISGAGGNVMLKGLTSDSAGDTITLGANSIVISGPVANTNVIMGAIQGTGGLQIAAGDTVTLEGQNTYSGATVVSGTLDLTGSTVTMGAGNVSLKIGSVSNGVFDISGVTATDANGNHTFQIGELTGQTQTQVHLGDNTLVVNETVAASFSGVISGAAAMAAGGGNAATPAGGFEVNGTQVLTLNGAAETYTGQTTINGSLAIGPSGSIADSVRVVDDGSLMLGTSTTLNDLTGHGTLNVAGFTLTDTVTNTSVMTPDILSGAIHGSGVFNFQGTNTAAGMGAGGAAATTTTLVLSGAGSDFSGGIHIGGGTLEIATTGAAGTGAISFADSAAANNGVLQIDNTALTGNGTATESFANHINGMSNFDIIDLSGLSFNSTPGASSVISTNGLVTVSEGNASVTLQIDNATAADTFHVYQDSHGGTYIEMAGTTTTPDATHYHP